MEYKDLLERVRSLYIQATLIEDLQLQFQYCIDNNLQFGLCNAISTLYIPQSNITQFSYDYIDNLIDTCCEELTDKMFDQCIYNGRSRSIYNLLRTISYLGLHEQFKYSLKYTDPTSFLFPPLYAGAARAIQLGFEDRYITPRLQLLDWIIEQLTEYNKNVFIKPIPKFL